MKPEYSSANLVVGEEFTVAELLQLLLVHSANDAANVLAERVSGSVESFSDLMNQKAKEIGCENTHFVNPSGIHDDNHYTTAYDLSLIAKFCMKNTTFRKYVSMSKCKISATNKSAARQFSNTNELINSSSKYYIKDCIGVKTGYTSQAKNCLISAFSKDNLDLICVTLGGDYLNNGDNARFTDGKIIYNFGYSNYAIKTIAKKDDIIQTIEIKNGTKETKNLDLILEDDLNALTNVNEEISSPSIDIKEDLKAPIYKNQKLGSVTYTVNNTTYTIDLLASHDVDKDYSLFILLGIVLGIVVLLILFITIISCFKKNKKKKKNRNKYSGNY